MKKLYFIFCEYDELIHKTKDPGIFLKFFQEEFDTTLVCIKPNDNSVRALFLSRDEIYAGNWLSDENAILFVFHGSKAFVRLYQRAKNLKCKIIVKLDTDGHLVQKTWRFWDKAIYGQLRDDKIKINKYLGHFKKFLYINSWAKSRGYDFIDALIVESEVARKRYSSALPLYANKVHVIPNGYFFDYHVGNIHKENIISAAARWTDFKPKQPELLISVIKEIVTKNRDYRFVIAGTIAEKYLEPLQDLNESEKSRISFVGNLSHDEVLALYNESKISLSTSRWEGFPVSTLEALSRGNSLVTTPTAASEQTLDGECGSVSGWTKKSFVLALLGEISKWDVGDRSPVKIMNKASNYFDYRTSIIPKVVALIDSL
ncbi:MAG: glycosyltransferase family 4 protein [Bacillota bacterium]